MFMSLPLVLLLRVILIAFLLSSVPRCSKLPPGSNLLQFLLNISQFTREPHVAFKNLANCYGPLMCLRLGGQLLVVASSPATAKELLKTNGQICSGRYMPTVYYAIPSITRSSMTMSRECNNPWKFLRGIGHNFIFSTKVVDLKVEIRKVKVAEMMKYLVEREGQVVNLDDIVTTTLINIITNVLASRDLFDMQDDDHESFTNVKALLNEIVDTVAHPGLSDLFPVLKNIDFWSKPDAMVLKTKIIYVWKDIIEVRRFRCDTSRVDHFSGDFLDVLLDNEFLDDQIGMLLTELLIAGTDSTFITVIWLMVELLRYPEVLRKLRAEISPTFEGSTMNESLLSACEYLQACIKETLRLHIPGPFLLPHCATEKCKVGDYVIPKDSVILINAWAIQMDPNNWRDASVFCPQRFLDTKVDHRGTHFEYIPFSAGRRMCPGFNMSFRNIQLIVAYLVHYFDWEMPNHRDLSTLDTKDKCGTTFRMEELLCLIPKQREKYVV